MKLLKVGRTKIKCQRRDGKEKWYKAASKVINFAKRAFKTGDEVKAEFDDNTREIVKLTKSNFNKSGKSSGNNGSQYEKMVERSAVASAATALTAVEDVTTENVKTLFVELIDLALDKIHGKKVDTKVDDEDEELDEEELDDEDEEEEE